MPIRDALGLVERFNLELGFRFVDQLDRDVIDKTVGNVVDEREIPVLAALDPAMMCERVCSGSTMASRPRRPRSFMTTK
jgi:hypothetical protein